MATNVTDKAKEVGGDLAEKAKQAKDDLDKMV